MGGAVEFRILGPLEVRAQERRVGLRGPRQERCLAALLLRPGRLVTFDGLVEAAWDDPPLTARRQVQDLVSSLRRELSARGARDDLLVTQRSGYVLNVDAAQLDSLQFDELVATATKEAGTNPAGSAAMLRRALTLFRGATLAGIDSRALAPAAARWDELRRSVREQWLSLELELGNYGAAISELTELVTADPLRERPVELLMRALHATGRTPEALEAYQRLRRRLAEEVGLDPHPDLQELHRSMLRGVAIDERPAARELTSRAASASGTHPPAPAQLPPDVRGFAGRVGELRRLDEIAFASGQGSTAVVIAAVDGTAGIGKSALALHWAHRVADQFPDGQLYVNLRGIEPGESTMHPAEAVRGFLDAMHVPPARVPTTFEGQVGLYRSLLATKRMLIVLDNARDEAQVRPLLPGAPGCVVVVTSRNQLASLVAAEAAHPITLGLLTDDEARHLLTHRLGHEVVQAQRTAVDEIIASCERLPLALAIVAARASLRPRFPLNDLAAQLRETRGSLEAFTVGDPRVDMRAVFSWSYDLLSSDAARMFRLLGLHPGPDFAVPAAASLAGVPVARARAMLNELTRANLTSELAPGRFSFHDLLRVYAGEMAHAVDPEPDRRAAVLRLLDHYLHTAHAAALQLRPSRVPITLPGPIQGVVTARFAGWWEAQAWFTAEYRCLLAAVAMAAEQEFPCVWRLVWTLEDVLDWRGLWRELASAGRAALRCAQQRGDAEGEANAYNGLARALWRLGDHEQAHEYASTAAEIFAKLDDRVRQALTFQNLCAVRFIQGRYEEALTYAERGLELVAQTTDTRSLPHLLNSAGLMHAHLGNYEQGLAYCERALTARASVDEPILESAIVDTLGYIHHHLGNVEKAIECYQESVTKLLAADDRYGAARALVRLGDTYASAGQPDNAARVWQQALETFDRLDPAAASSLRDRMSQQDRDSDALPV